jgi:hypothetical protein
MKIIEIIVAPTGTTSVQTKGFTGASCRDASHLIEQSLGEKASEQLTAEFYQAQTQQQVTAKH